MKIKILLLAMIAGLLIVAKADVGTDFFGPASLSALQCMRQ